MNLSIPDAVSGVKMCSQLHPPSSQMQRSLVGPVGLGPARAERTPKRPRRASCAAPSDARSRFLRLVFIGGLSVEDPVRVRDEVRAGADIGGLHVLARLERDE